MPEFELTYNRRLVQTHTVKVEAPDRETAMKLGRVMVRNAVSPQSWTTLEASVTRRKRAHANTRLNPVLQSIVTRKDS